jgi:hypothetical protein
MIKKHGCVEKEEAMYYISVAIIKPSASQKRLRALVAELQTVDCLVKVDQQRFLLEFQVPEDMLSWLRAGGLSSMFANYADVVHWTKPFRETQSQEMKALPSVNERRTRSKSTELRA